MFNKKRKRIKALEERLKVMTNEAYALDGKKLRLWSKRYEESQEDIQTWSERWGDLAERFEEILAENTQLKAGLKDSRNKFAHYILEVNKLSGKIQGHKQELTERYNL